MGWVEVKTSRDELAEIRVAAHGASSLHQFFYEPWHPEGVVVRVLDPPKDLSGEEWDATPDERLYEIWWPEVYDFFAAGSALLPYVEEQDWRRRKLVHCLLNSWGMDVDDEIRFALKFAWERVRILWHFKFWHSKLLQKYHARRGCPWI